MESNGSDCELVVRLYSTAQMFESGSYLYRRSTRKTSTTKVLVSVRVRGAMVPPPATYKTNSRTLGTHSDWVWDRLDLCGTVNNRFPRSSAYDARPVWTVVRARRLGRRRFAMLQLTRCLLEL
eukprot:1004762-Amphidinium_carterae.4